MTCEDVAATAAWSRRTKFRLDLVANWGGSGARDLRKAFLKHEDEFGWINHTFKHLDLDHATETEIHEQIENSINCADAVGPKLDDRRELVTGEHSGLRTRR